MSKQFLTDAGLAHYHDGLSSVFLDRKTNESRINELETKQSEHQNSISELQEKTAIYEEQLSEIIGLAEMLEELI